MPRGGLKEGEKNVGDGDCHDASKVGHAPGIYGIVDREHDKAQGVIVQRKHGHQCAADIVPERRLVRRSVDDKRPQSSSHLSGNVGRQGTKEECQVVTSVETVPECRRDECDDGCRSRAAARLLAPLVDVVAEPDVYRLVP